MCGIVGHLGTGNSAELVIQGLERLEYRGYDSSGISFVDDNDNLQMFKKAGKITELKKITNKIKIHSKSCIGHTRWATHGLVTDENAHPHMSENISLVHNGIIENSTELKSELLSKGYEFKSETDSEVFLFLLQDCIKETNNFTHSVSNAFSKITGNSAFVILNKETSDIIAVKRGAPLVCGINNIKTDCLVASDAYALIGLVDKIYFPEDDVVCHISAQNENVLKFYEVKDWSISKRYKSKAQDRDFKLEGKGKFDHYMLKEIYEQPTLIRGLLDYYLNGDGLSVLKDSLKITPNRINITACGTAYYAGLVIKDFIETKMRIPCSAELASEFRYKNPILRSDEVGLFISQSGETADTLAAQTLCKESGLDSISILNVDGSTLFRESTKNLLIRAGIEIGVASTKAFTQQVLTGHLYASGLQGDLEDTKKSKQLTDKYSLLASRMDDLLDNTDVIKKVAEEIYNFNGFIFTGRGIYFPIALEGALKLKEIAYVHAEGYASGELKHGPIALIDESMVNIAIVGPELLEKTVSNIEEVRARKGKVLIIGPKENNKLQDISDFFIPLDFDGLDELSPLYVNIVNQLLSYYMAKFKGTDIDRPRNLAKSVTVE